MDFQFEWERLKEGIRLAEGSDSVEEDMAARLWKYLASVLGESEGLPRNGESALMEEIVCLRITAWRLERLFWTDGLFPARKEGGATGPVHPGVDTLAKTRERYRKAMKEFLDRFEGDAEKSGMGLADLVVPILKKGEGVLEDAIEFEARKKSAKKRGMNKQEIDRWLSLHGRAKLARGLLKARDRTAWRARDYQKVSLESWASRKVHCDGRDVGKTSEIEIMALWAMIARPRTEMLIAAQCENHLFPLMNRVVRRFEETPALKKSLVEIRRTPSWFLRFSNGFVLWGRIAGPRGMNFQGLHVDWQVVDEAQEMAETGWGELYQSLNGGGRRWVYGVPNGLRNAFFRMTQSPEAEQYNWPSSLNSEFTAEKDAELARLYGGKGAPGYLHRVLGQHGAPSHGVFNLDNYLACVDEGLEFVEAVLREEDAFAAPEGIGRGAYYLGCDLGYARDPSEFVVYRAHGPDLTNVARFRLEGVNYSRQQSIITELDRAYDFRAVGIDSGNNGRAVSHALMAEGVEWCEKITAIEFGSSIDLGEFPDGSARRRPVKEFMTELLRRGMADRSLVFPKMAERESQYAAHTYTVGHQGRIVYEKGNDHIIDADRCAMLCHYLDTHSVEQPRLGVRVEGF